MNLGNDAVYDDRNGRQEDVPTTDINLWQYGLEETWLAVINFYVYPRKCTFFPGHPGLDTGGHFFTVRYRLFSMRSTHYLFLQTKMWQLIVIGFTGWYIWELTIISLFKPWYCMKNVCWLFDVNKPEVILFDLKKSISLETCIKHENQQTISAISWFNKRNHIPIS